MPPAPICRSMAYRPSRAVVRRSIRSGTGAPLEPSVNQTPSTYAGPKKPIDVSHQSSRNCHERRFVLYSRSTHCRLLLKNTPLSSYEARTEVSFRLTRLETWKYFSVVRPTNGGIDQDLRRTITLRRHALQRTSRTRSPPSMGIACPMHSEP